MFKRLPTASLPDEKKELLTSPFVEAPKAEMAEMLATLTTLSIISSLHDTLKIADPTARHAKLRHQLEVIPLTHDTDMHSRIIGYMGLQGYQVNKGGLCAGIVSGLEEAFYTDELSVAKNREATMDQYTFAPLSKTQLSELLPYLSQFLPKESDKEFKIEEEMRQQLMSYFEEQEKIMQQDFANRYAAMNPDDSRMLQEYWTDLRGYGDRAIQFMVPHLHQQVLGDLIQLNLDAISQVAQSQSLKNRTAQEMLQLGEHARDVHIGLNKIMNRLLMFEMSGEMSLLTPFLKKLDEIAEKHHVGDFSITICLKQHQIKICRKDHPAHWKFFEAGAMNLIARNFKAEELSPEILLSCPANVKEVPGATLLHMVFCTTPASCASLRAALHEFAATKEFVAATAHVPSEPTVLNLQQQETPFNKMIGYSGDKASLDQLVQAILKNDDIAEKIPYLMETMSDAIVAAATVGNKEFAKYAIDKMLNLTDKDEPVLNEQSKFVFITLCLSEILTPLPEPLARSLVENVECLLERGMEFCNPQQQNTCLKQALEKFFSEDYFPEAYDSSVVLNTLFTKGVLQLENMEQRTALFKNAFETVLENPDKYDYGKHLDVLMKHIFKCFADGGQAKEYIESMLPSCDEKFAEVLKNFALSTTAQYMQVIGRPRVKSDVEIMQEAPREEAKKEPEVQTRATVTQQDQLSISQYSHKKH